MVMAYQALLMHVSWSSKKKMRVWPEVHRFSQDVLLCHADEVQSTGYGEISNLSVRATKGSLKEKLLLLHVKYRLCLSGDTVSG